MINNFQRIIFPRRRWLRGFRPGAGALLLALLATLNAQRSTARAFEGRLHATLTRGGEVQTLLYTVGTNCLRVARGETNWPYTVNLVHRDSGAVTLLFANNRSFVNLKSGTGVSPVSSDGSQESMGMKHTGKMPVPLPSAGVGSAVLPTVPGAGALPAMPQMPAADNTMPAMPAMPMMPMPGEALELKATDQTTNLLGYTCTRYELKQRGEVMEIWATDKLMTFQPYLQNQPPRFGPRMIEEQWGELMKAKKLFPLLAVLKFENGPERLRFEVQSVTPQRLTADDATLFQPPDGYQEIRPLPF